MPILIFTAVTTLVFGFGDVIVISLVMQPLFKATLGNQMLESLRLAPAALFYIIHIGGLVYVAGLPVLRGGSAGRALADGAVVGCVAYSCYEMTSWTIMRDWTVTLVIVDLAWGTLVSGVSAWTGALALRAYQTRRSG
jgi:uncharacterized membrane protein